MIKLAQDLRRQVRVNLWTVAALSILFCLGLAPRATAQQGGGSGGASLSFTFQNPVKPKGKTSTAKNKSKKKNKAKRKRVRRTRPQAQPSDPIFVTREILLAFAAAAPDTVINQVIQEFGLTRLADSLIALLDQRVVRARFSASLSASKALQLSNDPRVFVQPNYNYGLAASDQVQYALVKIGAVQAQEIARGGGILVAVIDSGVNAAHPALAGAITEEFNAVGGKMKRYEIHGTAVASIIAARNGMTGVAPQSLILSVRAFSRRSSKQNARGNSYDLLRGLDWAVQKGARILNMSFAGPRDPLLKQVIEAAVSSGVVAVAAAGNKGAKAPAAFPAAYDAVIAATATDSKDKLYKYANRGDYVTISAPGVEVLTAGRKTGFGLRSGTSMATAYVSGSVALMIQRSPELSPDTVMQRIGATARDLGKPGKDRKFGHGLLQVNKAAIGN